MFPDFRMRPLKDRVHSGFVPNGVRASGFPCGVPHVRSCGDRRRKRETESCCPLRDFRREHRVECSAVGNDCCPDCSSRMVSLVSGSARGSRTKGCGGKVKMADPTEYLAPKTKILIRNIETGSERVILIDQDDRVYGLDGLPSQVIRGIVDK